MPFIEQKLRQPLLKGKIQPEAVGDLCFLAYHDMVEEWKENPRWTTAHNIYKAVCLAWEINDENTARHLAWQVFFQNFVIPYENEKEKINGTIQ